MELDITIITVAFNSEKTIERTLNSVLEQSFQNFEYIIIDGGSTDNTNYIINGFKSKFGEKLTHISESDQGIYDAMNKGILRAKGKLIGLLNSDDYYFKTTLQKVHEAAQNSDVRSVITGEIIFKTETDEQHLKTSENRFIKKMKQYKNGVRHPATFIPKLIYNEIGLFDLNYKIASDADLIFRIERANYNFHFLNEPLVVMCDGGISNSNGITRQILLEKKQLLESYCPNRLLRFYFMTETRIRFKAKELTTGLTSLYRKLENN